MLSRLTLVIGLALLSSVSLFTQDVEAQRFRFRSTYRSNCPQPVRYVPPSCATIRFYVPAQSQMTGVQAAPVAPGSTATAPGPIGSPVDSATVNQVQPGTQIQRSTQTSNPVAPVPVSKPELNPPANVKPVPTGDTEIAPSAPVPPVLEVPKTEATKPAEVVAPQAQPTPAGAKSILDKGK